MADQPYPRDIRSLFHQFRTSEHWAVALARDLAWVAGVVGTIALILFLVCGTWPAVVTIESRSMEPDMNVGDLVVVVQKDRYGTFMDWDQGKLANVTKYNNYGDVIIYKPNGMTSVHPIIHRAITHVTAGDPVSSIRGYTLRTNYTPTESGYITWGDNNPAPDQFVSYPGIGTPGPVKDDQIVGKALFAVPLVGYLPLNIVPVIIVVIVVMVLHDFWLRSREEKESRETERKNGKKRGKD